MTPYDQQICRNMIMTTPVLYDCFRVKCASLGDTLGHKAVKQIFCSEILPSVYYREKYKALLEEVSGKPESTLVEAIDNLIRSYGWSQFFAALRFLIHGWRQRDLDKMNIGRLSTTLEKLSLIPSTVIVRKR